MYGKAPTYLLRLCGILHNLAFACKICKDLRNAGDDSQITSSFKHKFESRKDEYILKIKRIDENIVKSAKFLLDYYNINRMLLSGYDLQPGICLDTQVFSFLKYHNTSPDIDLSHAQIKDAKEMLKEPGNLVSLTKFSQSKRYAASKTQQIAEILVKCGLATLSSKKSGSSYREHTLLIKLPIEELKKDYGKVKALHYLNTT
jgi:hypothetical protein